MTDIVRKKFSSEHSILVQHSGFSEERNKESQCSFEMRLLPATPVAAVALVAMVVIGFIHPLLSGRINLSIPSSDDLKANSEVLKLKPEELKPEEKTVYMKRAEVTPDELKPSFSANCSCMAPFNDFNNATERLKCCFRTVTTAHKMGWQFLIQINRNHFAKIPGKKVRMGHLYSVKHITIEAGGGRQAQYDELMNQTYDASRDFRTLFVTRNWYDTLISGYLYHKSGRECYRSSGGKYNSKGWLMKFDWESFIAKSRNNETKYWPPPGAQRNLCKYLETVSPEEGMRVYMDLALARWLRPILVLANARKYSSVYASNRTIFLCYENFSNSEEFPASIEKAGSFLYPGDPTDQWEGRTGGGSENVGHSTSRDKELRGELKRIIENLDSKYFSNEVQAGSATFGCSSEIDEE